MVAICTVPSSSTAVFLASFTSSWSLDYHWFDQGMFSESILRNSLDVKGVFYTCAMWPGKIDCMPLTGENVTKTVKACHIPKTFT